MSFCMELHALTQATRSYALLMYYTVMHMLVPPPCSPPGWRTSQRRSTERPPTDCTWSRRDRRESYRSSGPPLLPLPPPATPLHTPHRGIHVAFIQGTGEVGFCFWSAPLVSRQIAWPQRLTSVHSCIHLFVITVNLTSSTGHTKLECMTRNYVQKGSKLWIMYMWQSRIELEYYSVAYFKHITEFDAL